MQSKSGSQKTPSRDETTRQRYSPTRMSSIWMNLAFSLIKAASYDAKMGFQNGSVRIPLPLDKHCRDLQQTLIERDSTKRQSRNTNLINLGRSDWNFSICIFLPCLTRRGISPQFSQVSIPFACKKTCFHHTLWRVWRKHVKACRSSQQTCHLVAPGMVPLDRKTWRLQNVHMLHPIRTTWSGTLNHCKCSILSMLTLQPFIVAL